jgi:hypothetical protein
LSPIVQRSLGEPEGRIAFANHGARSIEAESGAAIPGNPDWIVRQREFARVAEEILDFRGGRPVG